MGGRSGAGVFFDWAHLIPVSLESCFPMISLLEQKYHNGCLGDDTLTLGSILPRRAMAIFAEGYCVLER